MSRLIKNLQSASCLALCVMALLPVSAKADVNAIRSSDSAIWGAVGPSFFNYKEYVASPDLPDSEHGWLPSLAGGISWMGPHDIYLAFEASGAFGTASYNGSFFASPTTPLQGTTHETTANVDGKVGKGFAVGDMLMVTPYIELGYRYWDRNLGGGDLEDYQNGDVLAGVMVQVAPTDSLILTAYGSAGSTFGAQMRSSPDTYYLGSAGMYKLGGKVGYDLTQRVEIFTTVDYDYFRYGSSNVALDDTYEPDSRTEETIMRVGIAYHFR